MMLEMSDYLPTLSIVIPAFNESKSIGKTLDTALELARIHHWEVIVVDDGSKDDTGTQIANRNDQRYLKSIRHFHNRGYGAALKTGINAATAGVVATIDSDGQHDPNDILRLLPLAKEYDLVIGERRGLIHSEAWRMPGKWVLKWLANYLTKSKIADLNSGMRVFHKAVMRKYLHLFPDGFSFSTTSTLTLHNRGYTVRYVPITVGQRPGGARSTVKLKTGFDTFVLILRLACLFQPLRVFIPAGSFFGMMGVLWGLPYVFLERGVSVGALLLILTGLLLFFFGLLTDQVAQLRLEKYE